MNLRNLSIVSLASLSLTAPSLRAEVKTVEKTHIEFPGLLGGLMKTFGGKAAKEGVVETVAVKGDRKMTVGEDTAELVDLSEEKVYQIDLKKKTYTVITFAQMKQQMEDQIAKAKAQMATQTPAPAPEPTAEPAQKPDFAIDFKLEETGQKKMINGFDCHEIMATVTLRQKDKPAEDGSMVLTSSMWLTPRIAAMKEIDDFNRRYAEKLVIPLAREMAVQMGPAVAAYPGLSEAMGKLQAEKVNMDGTEIMTVVQFQAIGNADTTASATPAEPQKQPEIPTSLGGLLRGIGRKTAPTKPQESDSSKPGALMTSNHEVVSVLTSVSDSDVSIPAGFKEKK